MTRTSYQAKLAILNTSFKALLIQTYSKIYDHSLHTQIIIRKKKNANTDNKRNKSKITRSN